MTLILDSFDLAPSVQFFGTPLSFGGSNEGTNSKLAHNLEGKSVAFVLLHQDHAVIGGLSRRISESSRMAKSKREKARPPTKEQALGSSDDKKCLCFQDVMESYQKEEEGEGNDVAAHVFFELANAPMVSYRIQQEHEIANNRKGGKSERLASIRIHQDHKEACGQHTGGIVWETSFLLLNFLRQRYLHDELQSGRQSPSSNSKYPCGKTVLEVGAGCGLLGLGIYHSRLAKRVILTETDSVLPNLQRNVEENFSRSKKRDSDRIRVCALDWTRYREDCERSHIEHHSVDMIVGTDVVFSTRLVQPLLETLRYLSHSETTILLCLQERCPDAHRLLLESAESHGMLVQNISEQVISVATCEWGRELDCCILQFQVSSAARCSNHKLAKKKRKRVDK